MLRSPLLAYRVLGMSVIGSRRRAATRLALPSTRERPGPRTRCREPATRSVTVRDTRTSPAPAAAPTRAPMLTAIPAHVAVRAARPRRCAARRGSRCRARAPVARVDRGADRARGPVERREEPVAHRLHLVAAVTLELHGARSRHGARATPAIRGRRARRPVCVESTMSVNITVASMRSGSGADAAAGEELLDLVDDLLRVDGEEGGRPRPARSASRLGNAGGEHLRLLERDHAVARRGGRSSVGAVIVGSTSPTSMSLYRLDHALRLRPGSSPSRRSFAHQRCIAGRRPAKDDQRRSANGPPQSRRANWMNLSIARRSCRSGSPAPP